MQFFQSSFGFHTKRGFRIYNITVTRLILKTKLYIQTQTVLTINS